MNIEVMREKAFNELLGSHSFHTWTLFTIIWLGIWCGMENCCDD